MGPRADNLLRVGGSYNQFKVLFKKFGIEFRFVEGDNPQDFKKHIDSKTKAICTFTPLRARASTDPTSTDLESIGNPKYNIVHFPHRL